VGIEDLIARPGYAQLLGVADATGCQPCGSRSSSDPSLLRRSDIIWHDGVGMQLYAIREGRWPSCVSKPVTNVLTSMVATIPLRLGAKHSQISAYENMERFSRLRSSIPAGTMTISPGLTTMWATLPIARSSVYSHLTVRSKCLPPGGQEGRCVFRCLERTLWLRWAALGRGRARINPFDCARVPPAAAAIRSRVALCRLPGRPHNLAALQSATTAFGSGLLSNEAK